MTRPDDPTAVHSAECTLCNAWVRDNETLSYAGECRACVEEMEAGDEEGVEFGTCEGGTWRLCPNAVSAQENGFPVMRCTVSGKHPDLCHNYSKPHNVVRKTYNEYGP